MPLDHNINTYYFIIINVFLTKIIFITTAQLGIFGCTTQHSISLIYYDINLHSDSQGMRVPAVNLEQGGGVSQACVALNSNLLYFYGARTVLSPHVYST